MHNPSVTNLKLKTSFGLILYLLGVSLSSLGVSDALGEGRLKFSAISIEYSEDGVMLGRIFSRLSTKVTFVTATCFLLCPIVSESSQINLVEPISAQKDTVALSIDPSPLTGEETHLKNASKPSY